MAQPNAPPDKAVSMGPANATALINTPAQVQDIQAAQEPLAEANIQVAVAKVRIIGATELAYVNLNISTLAPALTKPEVPELLATGNINLALAKTRILGQAELAHARQHINMTAIVQMKSAEKVLRAMENMLAVDVHQVTHGMATNVHVL